MASANVPTGQDVQSSLRIEVFTQLEQLDALRPAWIELLVRSPGSVGFSAPGAVLPWFRSVSSHSGIHVVSVWRHDELVGLAPFSVLRLGPFHVYCSPGAGFGFYGGPLLGPEPKAVADVLSEHISDIVHRGIAAVYLRRVPVADHLLGALAANDVNCFAIGADETNGVVRFDLMENPEDYFARVGRKHQIPRRSRRLAEHFTTLDMLVADPEPDAAFETIREMLNRRSGEDPRIFRDAHLRSLTHEMVRELGTDGHGQTSTIMADGRRILVTWNLRVGPRIFGYIFASEPEFQQLGLGHLGYYYSLRKAYDSGILEVDLDGLSGFTFKRNWADSLRHYRTVAVTAPGRRGTFENHLRRATTQVHRRLLRTRRNGPAVI